MVHLLIFHEMRFVMAVDTETPATLFTGDTYPLNPPLVKTGVEVSGRKQVEYVDLGLWFWTWTVYCSTLNTPREIRLVGFEADALNSHVWENVFVVTYVYGGRLGGGPRVIVNGASVGDDSNFRYLVTAFNHNVIHWFDPQKTRDGDSEEKYRIARWRGFHVIHPEGPLIVKHPDCDVFAIEHWTVGYPDDLALKLIRENVNKE